MVVSKLLNTFALHFSEKADVAKLVDALDLGSSAARHGGSSPSIRTNYCPQSRLHVLSGLGAFQFFAPLKLYCFGHLT